MTLPVSPASIAMSQINTELGLAATSKISLNDAIVRTLLGKPTTTSTISMNDGYGKSDRARLSRTLSAASSVVITVSSLPGYVAGKTDLTITVPTGVVLSGNFSVASGSVSSPALTINGTLTAGDTVTLINNGSIIGHGGNGDRGTDQAGTNTVSPGPSPGYGGGSGGAALSTTVAISVRNNGYICGGGGGGGGGGGSYIWPRYASGPYYGGSGGGGGAGIPVGAGGDRGRNTFWRLYYNNRATYGNKYLEYTIDQDGNDGSPGSYTNVTTYAGGAGGAAINDECGAGAAGGGLGAGGPITWDGYPLGYPGTVNGVKPANFLDYAMNFTGQIGSFSGTGGAYIVGNNKVTWLATGTRLGLVQP